MTKFDILHKMVRHLCHKAQWENKFAWIERAIGYYDRLLLETTLDRMSPAQRARIFSHPIVCEIAIEAGI